MSSAAGVSRADPSAPAGWARGAIMRRDFGIIFGLAADSKIVVGDRVDITFDVQAVLDA